MKRLQNGPFNVLMKPCKHVCSERCVNRVNKEYTLALPAMGLVNYNCNLLQQVGYEQPLIPSYKLILQII